MYDFGIFRGKGCFFSLGWLPPLPFPPSFYILGNPNPFSTKKKKRSHFLSRQFTFK